MTIEIGKKYRTRSGIEVRILAVDLDNEEYTVAGFIKGSGVYTYTSEGQFAIPYSQKPEDLVEVCEWDDFKIDDKVMVRRNNYDTWHKQYFAGVNEDGKPTAFLDGRTSWGNVSNRAIWDKCRRPTEEELK